MKKTLRCFQGKLLYFWFMYMGDFEQDMVLMNIIIAIVVVEFLHGLCNADLVKIKI